MTRFFAGARARLAYVTPVIGLVLIHSMLFGLAVSIADLLFNFYLASLGFGNDVAGLLSTVFRMAGVILGIPIGMLIDRIGARSAVITGAFLFSCSWLALLFVSELWALVLVVFISGAVNILTLTAIVPLLVHVTPLANRAAVFGVNASVSLVIGLVGSLSGGLLPQFAANLLAVGPRDVDAYRLALASVVLLTFIAVLPLTRTPKDIGKTTGAARPDEFAQRQPIRRLLIFTLPAFLLGVGGGAFLPFQNLFFRQNFALDDAAVGAMLAAAALSMGLGAMLGAPLAARIGTKRAAAAWRLVSVPAMLLLMVPVLPVALVGYLLRGLSIAASYPLVDALVMQSTSAKQRGLAVSLTSLAWSLGWAITSALSGWAQVQYGFAPGLIVGAVSYLASAAAIYLTGFERDQH
jgi:MFS family permease